MKRVSGPVSVLLYMLVVIWSLAGCQTDAQPATILREDFQQGTLDAKRWKITQQNDFNQSIVDVIDVGQEDLRLRMLANTIGTTDDTVKYQGVRSRQRIDFSEGSVISFELDWNDQSNGSYLAAGLYLCPVATDKNPREEVDWIAFEYIGVPPGENARFQVAKSQNGNFRFLYTEGWPDQQKTGRRIGTQRVQITIGTGSLAVSENGEKLFSSSDHDLPFSDAYLYLQMSSHSNYPSREVYFDNIVVETVAASE